MRKRKSISWTCRPRVCRRVVANYTVAAVKNRFGEFSGRKKCFKKKLFHPLPPLTSPQKRADCDKYVTGSFARPFARITARVVPLLHCVRSHTSWRKDDKFPMIPRLRRTHTHTQLPEVRNRNVVTKSRQSTMFSRSRQTIQCFRKAAVRVEQ